MNDSGPPSRSVTRPATTFKVRRRGLSAKRRAEFDQWIETYGIDVRGATLDWDEVFGRDDTSGSSASRHRGVVLDIGFGHGESTIALARREPDLAVIGVEVHTPGVVTVLDAIAHEPLPLVRVVHGDLLAFLDRVGPERLHGVQVFFPDPWPKARQHHRRLVRDDVIAALTDRLEIGGFLHLATDIDDYAEQMAAACAAELRLTGGIVARPDDRPLTRFERRGLEAGRRVTDLRFTRRRGPE